MKRKQKRYNNERAILADIYAAQRKQTEWLKAAEDHESKADTLIQASLKAPLCKEEVEELGWQKELAGKARRSAERLNGVVAKLRLAQDAFDTETLSFTKDKSVVL